MLLVMLACIAILGGVFAITAIKVREADETGELRFRVRGSFVDHCIRRAENPDRFELELKFLRAVPWIGLSALSLAVLGMGLSM